MIFPNLALWSRPAPDDAVAQIERSLEDRQHRLSIGLSLDSTFGLLHGALLVTQGRGRFVRFQHAVGTCMELPSALASACQRFHAAEENDVAQLRWLLRDLAELQASMVRRLKGEAGKYVDRILAIGVVDPGIWPTDFDGSRQYLSMCDAAALAEMSGINVVDAFPARDIAAGGRGEPLTPLPVWLLTADRNQRVASIDRTLIDIGSDETIRYQIPAFDGLDAELPNVKLRRFPGTAQLDRFADALARQFSLSSVDHDTWVVDSLSQSELRSDVVSWIDHHDIDWSADNLTHERMMKLCRGLAQRFAAKPEEAGGLLAGYADALVGHWLGQSAGHGSSTRSEVWFVAESDPVVQALVNRSAQLANAVTLADKLQTSATLGALVASLLALLHVDQLPANMPALTGASCQRILGQLTPGSPSNWRNLIRGMAQYRPAPMKLKDAV